MTRRSRSSRRRARGPGAELPRSLPAGRAPPLPPPPPPPRRHPSTPREADLQEEERVLSARVLERDRLFEEARRVRRASQDAMRRFHAGEDPGGSLRALAGAVRALQRNAAGHEGVVADALQEYAEARLLEAVVQARPLPTLRELEVPVEVHLLALGDLVGEVRRLAVSAMGREDLALAESLLTLMEDLLHALLRFEAPRGIAALKPKQDTARSLVERTRGELALAKVLRRAARAAALASGEEPGIVAEGLKAVHRLG